MTNKHASLIDLMPEIYDSHLGPYLFEFAAKDLAGKVKDNIPPDGRVLELACGTGILTYHLRQILPSTVHITATDLNSVSFCLQLQ
jgi:predicted RNA methylase